MNLKIGIKGMLIFFQLFLLTFGISWFSSYPWADLRQIAISALALIVSSTVNIEHLKKKIEVRRFFLATRTTLFFLILSLFFSNDWRLSLFGDEVRGFSFLSLLLVLVFPVYTLSTYFHFLRYIDILFLSVSFTFIVICALQLGGIELVESIADNDFSKIVFTFGNPNFASAFGAMLFAYILAQLMFYKHKKSFVVNCYLTSSLILLFIFTILTKSTQGIVIEGICVAIYCAIRIYIRKGKKSLIFSAFGILILFLAIGINLRRNVHIGDSFVYRIEMWHTALRVYSDFPWFGVGAGNFRFYYPEYSHLNLIDGFGNRVISDDPHNWILNGLVSWGTLPIVLILLLKVYVFWLCTREFSVIRGTEYFTSYISYFGAWLSLELSFLISPWNSTLSLWSSFLMGLLLSVILTKSHTHAPTLKKRFRYRNSIQTMVIFASGLISIMMTTRFTSDILEYEAFMRTNSSNLLSYSENRVIVSSDFRKYRQDAKHLINDSLHIGINRKIAVAKKYELTGNLEFAAFLHKMILVENPRAFESLYSLGRIYEILGDNKQSIYYQALAEKVFPRYQG